MLNWHLKDMSINKQQMLSRWSDL